MKNLRLHILLSVSLLFWMLTAYAQYEAGDTIYVPTDSYAPLTIEAEWNATNVTPIEGKNVPVELDGRIVIGDTKTGSVLGYPIHVGAGGGSFILSVEYKGFTGYLVEGYIYLTIDDGEQEKIKLNIEGWNTATSKPLLLTPGFYTIYTEYKGNSGTFNIDKFTLSVVPGTLQEKNIRQISALSYNPDTIEVEDYDVALSSITEGKFTTEGENPTYVSNVQDKDTLTFPMRVGSGGGLFDFKYIYKKLTANTASIKLYLDGSELENIDLSTTESVNWESVGASTSISLSPGYHELEIAINGSDDHSADYFVLRPVENSLFTSHPIIYVNAEERSQILDKIATYDWADNVFSQIKNNVLVDVIKHITDPASVLKTIPDFGIEGDHKALQLGLEAGIVYYLTSEVTYAQFSADILSYYCKKLADKTPETTVILGDDFQDGRQTYPHIALMYDFIYGFIKYPTTTVYDIESDSRLPFDNVAAQKAMINIAGNMLQEYGDADEYGRRVSNHHILQAPGSLFPILCIEDDEERERLFNVFWEIGTKHQASFTKTILPMYLPQGIWPESVSYSFMTHVPMILNIVDRIKPELNTANNYRHILEGSLIFPNLKNPNGTYIRYGDSKRLNEGSDVFYRYILHIAERNGYDDLKEQAEITLKQYYNNIGGYFPTPQSSLYDHPKSLELFWGMEIPDSVVGNVDYKTTVIIEHAGVAMQRNFVEQDNELYGLNGYIGGAHYVHSHCTGIAMELYGAGYVMAPNGGLPPSVAARANPDHTDYFRLYAGNNTVIVNGTSHGIQQGAWKNESNLWQNTTVNKASEPLHLQDPISNNFSFATQFLKDEVNNCDQERTLSVIRTSETTGYYFDLFRSKSLSENKFHDYIYHNLGDQTIISNSEGVAFPLSSTDRYDNDINDVVHSPGWRFFEDESVTDPTSDEVKVRFHIEYDNRYMNMFVPGGIEREYTKAVAPPTREARNGYVNKKTQVLAIRQQGEAWKRPYIAILEPSTEAVSSVQSTQQLVNGDEVIGAKIVSKVGSTIITDYIISQATPDSITLLSQGITFKGRFAIVRKELLNDKEKVTLYIGEGEKLTYGDTTLIANEKKQGLKIYEQIPILFYSIYITAENGTVTKSPNFFEYISGCEVQLTVTSDSAYQFDAWSGDASGIDSTLTIIMDTVKNITAIFSLIPNYYTLNVSVENGSVVLFPDQTEYSEGTEVSLTATSEEGYQFDGWTGDVIDSINPLTIKMDSDKTITANFSVVNRIYQREDSDNFTVYPNPSYGSFLINLPLIAVG
ncbi:MAG: heparinase II/III family protein, partial [Bacteroidales bacterium]|nr:heparinase II/III family protein [Bacteroidales bacterium]